MVRPVYSKKHRSRRPNKRTRRVKKRRGQCGGVNEGGVNEDGVNELVKCPICLENFDKAVMFSFHNYFFDMGNRHCICAGCMASILEQPGNHICPICRHPYTESYMCNIPIVTTVILTVGRGFAKLIPIRRPATTGQYPTYSTV